MGAIVSRRNKTLFIAVVGGIAVLLVCAAIVSVPGSRTRVTPSPLVQVVSATPSEVRVRAVKSKAPPIAHTAGVAASRAVAIICGADEATADRYEARNGALRAIARRRDLPKEDVAALVAYLRAADSALRVGRVRSDPIGGTPR